MDIENFNRNINRRHFTKITLCLGHLEHTHDDNFRIFHLKTFCQKRRQKFSVDDDLLYFAVSTQQNRILRLGRRFHELYMATCDVTI